MTPREIAPLSLTETLMHLDSGETVEQAAEKIRDVARSVIDTGNGGSVTIKLSFAPNGKRDLQAVKVTGAVTATMPKQPKTDAFFFVTDEGDLTRQNPLQPSLTNRTGENL